MGKVLTKKIVILLTAIAVTSLLATILICNAIVIVNASDKIFDKAEDIPYRKVGLVYPLNKNDHIRQF